MADIAVAQIENATLFIIVSDTTGMVTGLRVENSRSDNVYVSVTRNGEQFSPAGGISAGVYPPGTFTRNIPTAKRWLYDDPNDPDYESGLQYSLGS